MFLPLSSLLFTTKQERTGPTLVKCSSSSAEVAEVGTSRTKRVERELVVASWDLDFSEDLAIGKGGRGVEWGAS
jgi:hypothetical protein